jgi:ADP-ribose pyrophosphatase YjhB (NUDIX family)
VGVGALITKGDAVLLVKRRFDPGRGLWSVPGGLLELGETLQAGVKREILEETGLEVELDSLLDIVDLIDCDESARIRYHYVLIDYLAHPLNGKIKMTPEVEDIRWVKVDELSRYPTTRTAANLLR